MAKNILIFADGTGNEGGLLPDESRTNVYKLFRVTRTGPDSPIDPAKRPPAHQQSPQGRQGRPGIVHSSIYLPEALYEAIREAAFRERCKIHDIVLEGIELALWKRGWRE
jgi:hypothetical protein